MGSGHHGDQGGDDQGHNDQGGCSNGHDDPPTSAPTPSPLCPVPERAEDCPAPTECGLPLGSDLTGEGGSFGVSTAVSQDGRIVAVGAPNTRNGEVRVFYWNCDTWTLLGSPLDGPEWIEASSRFGSAVALSGDGYTLAVGAPNEGRYSWGQASVYDFVDGEWVERTTFTRSGRFSNFGGSVSLSCDGSILAVGKPGEDQGLSTPVDASGTDRSGAVEFQEWNGTEWTKLGEINSLLAGAELGSAIALSASGSTVVVGVPSNFFSDGLNNPDSVPGESPNPNGQAQIFSIADGQVSQIGPTIEGAAGSATGSAVDISSDGSLVIVGAPNESGRVGAARVFEIDSSGAWVQVGSTLTGEPVDPSTDLPDIPDEFGTSVAISGDGSTIAVGSPLASTENGRLTGLVRVYRLVDGDWVQLCNDFSGLVEGGLYSGTYFGGSVSLSEDGSTLVIGQPFGGDGLVQVYALP